MTKFVFERKNETGEHIIATVTIEPDAVVVTEKDASSRSLGRPMRIPKALCQVGIAEEAQIRCMEFKARGFDLTNLRGNCHRPSRWCSMCFRSKPWIRRSV